MVSKHDTQLRVGVEIAESATHLTATTEPNVSGLRWQARLAAPPTPEIATAEIASLIARVAHEIVATHSEIEPNVAAVGIAVGGQVNAEQGIVLALPQAVSWTDFPLVRRLTERLSVPIQIDSATNAACLAEFHIGAGKAAAHMLYVHVGRGIASAYIEHGQLLHGAQGAAGALGHLLVCMDGPRCSCGAHGHLEPIASAQSVVRRMIGQAADHDSSHATMLQMTGGRAEAITVAQIVELSESGEPVARAVVNDALDALSLALAHAVTLLAPDIIVVGGPFAIIGEPFLIPLRARVQTLCQPFTRMPELVGATLEPRAAQIGAYLLAEAITTPLG